MDTKLIGRKKELSKLSEMLNNLDGHKGELILFSGESGVGKTTLAIKTLQAANLYYLVGRSNEKTTPSYGPITSILREFLRQNQNVFDSCGPFANYLSMLLPELGDPPQNPNQETFVEAIAESFRKVVCTKPVAIVFDDLHWADNATLELLPILSEQLQTEPVIFIGTYRSDDGSSDSRLRWLRNELRRSKRLMEIALRPFSIEESQELMQTILQDDVAQNLAEDVHEKTQGIPLFIEELTHAIQSQNLLMLVEDKFDLAPGADIPLPESIRDAVLLQLDGLSEDAKKQVEIAALIGVEFDLNLLTKLSGTESGLDELLEKMVFIETHRGVASFRHKLTHQAMQDEITWTRRRALSRSIAENLERMKSSPEIIAAHWLAANETEKARVALLASVDRACQLYAYRDAAISAGRALEIWDEGQEEEKRIALLENMAHCAQASGLFDDATRALRELLESKTIQKNKKRKAETQRALATIYGLQGIGEESLTTRKAAAQTFEEIELLDEAAIELLIVAQRNTGVLRLKDALDFAQRAADFADKTKRWDIKARAMGLAGNILAMQGKNKQGCETVEAGLSLALKHNLPEAASEVYRRLGSALEYSSEYTASREAYDRAYNYCRTQGVGTQAKICLSCMSWVLWRTGDWAKTIEVCNELLEGKDEAGAAIAMGVLGLVRLNRGETKSARKYLEQSMRAVLQADHYAGVMIIHWGLGILNSWEGQIQTAENHYLHILELQEKTADVHDSLPGLYHGATFFAENNKPKETVLFADKLGAISSKTGNSEAMATLAYALAEVSMVNGDYEAAAKQFRQAYEQLEKLEIPLDLAQFALRAGNAYRLSNQQEKAVHYLRTSYRLARKLGARPLAAQASEALEKLGETVEERRSADAEERTNRAGLTERQFEIARLLAEGLTNKEIAGRLYLSPRTVDMHVGNILERLDCRSRAEAVKKAAELGLLA